jgi:outer membrane protein TolC
MAAILVGITPALAEEFWHFIFPEQRQMDVRDPTQLPRARLPDLPKPVTVADAKPELRVWHLSLDEAIRTALANSEVVRVLAGAGATSSGSTIYDPAIANTEIDRARAKFDPTFQVRNSFGRDEVPVGPVLRGNPPRLGIEGIRTDAYNMQLGLSKPTVTGGSLNLNVNTTPERISAGSPLSPQTPSSVDLSLTQPVLQGAGMAANLVPVELARIDTERSFFQLKDSVQRLVQGVIQAYWALVFARTDVWARQQQVEQGQSALDRAEANWRTKRRDISEVAQARSALAGFKATLVASEANVLEREAALRNILGLPPSDDSQIVPVTPPPKERLAVQWDELLRTAETYRPDLIELKLILEADQQQILLARNDALPRLDATALYRWNGLEGRTPDGTLVVSEAGQFTGWQFGVNFSVPLGLRQARAGVRRQELILARDRAQLDQALHAAAHSLATTYRNLAQTYQQYEAFRDARQAAFINLGSQQARYRSGFTLYLNVLQAISQWGNVVSEEAQALTQYAAELATLDQQTGRILEAHGIRFVEERYGSIGPLGRLFEDRCYPLDRRPTENENRYGAGTEPAERAFDLEPPPVLGRGKPGPTPVPLPGVPQEAPDMPLPEEDPPDGPRLPGPQGDPLRAPGPEDGR